ncbi:MULTISPECIES: hypothetical protein [Clostridia]|uniref:hypothetical protein n=1 Tax=Clostridia TaxID=186801 RepID=UPI0011DDB006|nr:MULTISPECIES: hypothetical protein [Clostridiaceae]
MKIIKKILIPIFAVILLIVGFVKINIINTESLSPLGNTDDNFKVVSEEFGEDFQEFIKDNSTVKIYVGEKKDGLATVKIYNKEIKLTSDNLFMNTIKTAGEYINNAFININDKINKSTKTNSEYNEDSVKTDEDDKNDFDKSVDDFIENINN